MSNEGDLERPHLEKISMTCIASFYTRAKYYLDNHNLAYIYNEYADYIDSDDLYKKYFPGCENPGEMTCFMIAREQIIIQNLERSLHRNEIQNIIFLGCGISPLPLYFAENAGRFGFPINVFATDLHPPLSLQKELVEKFVSRSHVEHKLKFLELDITNTPQFNQLSDRLSPGSVALVAEGVFPYFLKEDWDISLKNIRKLLHEKGGFFLTDLATRQGIQNSPFQEDSKRLLHACYRNAEIPMDSLPFATSQECTEYLTKSGFQHSWERLTGPEEFWHKIKLPVLSTEEKFRIEKMLSRPSMLKLTVD